MENYANIMLLGRTGVGKSSFINYLLGKDVCEVATGRPVTQGFETYEFDNNGIPLRVYDSKGLEVKDYSTQRKEILNFIIRSCNDKDVFNWLHTIFYCINIERRRLEPEEVDFIKSIKGNIAQNVHIIITHCNDDPNDPDRKNMESYLYSQLGNENKIYFVNSVVIKQRKKTVPQFGREIVLDEIFKLLWQDISMKISREYSEELYNGYMNIYYKQKDIYDSTLGKISTFKMLRFLSGDKKAMKKIDKAFETKDADLSSYLNTLNENYQKKIKPLVNFYNSYSNSMGSYIQTYDIWDFGMTELNEADREELLMQTQLGKKAAKYARFKKNAFLEIFGDIGEFFLALSIKGYTKELIDLLLGELQSRIPSKEVIQETVYEKLTKQCEEIQHKENLN